MNFRFHSDCMRDVVQWLSQNKWESQMRTNLTIPGFVHEWPSGFGVMHTERELKKLESVEFRLVPEVAISVFATVQKRELITADVDRESPCAIERVCLA